ncbi:hypothetical protein C8R45DRAFT_932362 [Mycena sanguinolenta]|nr:hypothetical protein C8R45DRAFT_932362 [Mycena sanguinolenta]
MVLTSGQYEIFKAASKRFLEEEKVGFVKTGAAMATVFGLDRSSQDAQRAAIWTIRRIKRTKPSTNCEVEGFWMAICEVAGICICKKVFESGRICDSCAKNIRGTRRFCIQCLDDKFDNGIDLCSECSEETPSSLQGLNFTHKRSHFLVETTRRIHDGSMGWIVWATNSTVERVGERSRAAQASPSGMDGLLQPDRDVSKSQSEPARFHCCYCEKPLVRPFWACIECEKDTYVCMDCDAKGSCLANCGTLCVESRLYHASQTKSRPQRQDSLLPQPPEGQEPAPDSTKYGHLETPFEHIDPGPRHTVLLQP